MLYIHTHIYTFRRTYTYIYIKKIPRLQLFPSDKVLLHPVLPEGGDKSLLVSAELSDADTVAYFCQAPNAPLKQNSHPQTECFTADVIFVPQTCCYTCKKCPLWFSKGPGSRVSTRFSCLNCTRKGEDAASRTDNPSVLRSPLRTGFNAGAGAPELPCTVWQALLP